MIELDVDVDVDVDVDDDDVEWITIRRNEKTRRIDRVSWQYRQSANSICWRIDYRR